MLFQDAGIRRDSELFRSRTALRFLLSQILNLIIFYFDVPQRPKLKNDDVSIPTDKNTCYLPRSQLNLALDAWNNGVALIITLPTSTS